MSVFKAYSTYYDLLYREKDYLGEVEYICGLIKRYTPDAETILNLGCGTGKHDYLFAGRGFDVVGVDLSADMIRLARSKAEEFSGEKCPVFFQGDLLTVSLNRKFDSVVSLFHVMSYQTVNADLEQAFRNAFEHLQSGGVFIFDCWYGPGVLTDRPGKREKKMEDEHMSIRRLTTPTMYPNENCVNVHFDVEVFDKDNGNAFQLEEDHKLRYLFYQDIEFLAAQLNFSILLSETWMTKAPLDFSSWNAVFICQSNKK